MTPENRLDDRRALLDAKLTELVLFAKALCPAATIEGSAIQYEDEDGRVEMFPPPSCFLMLAKRGFESLFQFNEVR